MHAGEIVFGRGQSPLYTLLGSCICVIVWHPRTKHTGMCHFALPETTVSAVENSDFRYAEHCFDFFANKAKEKCLPLSEFETHIIGGGNINQAELPKQKHQMEEVERTAIGDKNAMAAMNHVSQLKLSLKTIDVGENGYRKVWFNPVVGQGKVTLCKRTGKKQELRKYTF